MTVDKIYIINLEHRTDRKESVTKELEKVEIKDFEFFKAVAPSEKDVTERKGWLENSPSGWENWYKGEPMKYKRGQLGCLKSHLEIIKNSLKNNYKTVLILEDDAGFEISPELKTFENAIKYIDNTLDELKFGLFYLGGTHVRDGIELVKPNLYKTFGGTGTTSSYLITKEAMEYVAEDIESCLMEIDVYYQNVIQQKFDCYFTHPSMCVQKPSWSDITQRDACSDFNKFR